MPYTHKKIGDKECVYKKDTGAKVGCTKGPIEKYLAALHANANESVTETNTIKGGKADKMSVEDIAKKFKVSVDKIKAQLKKGIEIEKEHTSDKEKATEIAMDHVTEFPDYYDRIEKMEKKADKDWKLNETKKFIKQKLRKSLNEQQVNNVVAWRVGSMDLRPESGGIWFAETKDGAEKFAKSVRHNNDEAKGYVINMKNPKYFDAFWHGYILITARYGYDREKLMNALIDAGYDGMYIDEDWWNDTGNEFAVFSKQYVVFDKSQIRPI
ncbi:MAG: DUF5661 family protein [Bacteroidota bacterium]|jgi:hypothetical protein